jgi:coenzyme F420-0:L-glutamate ligase/coenzyme F420-1:gamma-L-glutamate ligase
MKQLQLFGFASEREIRGGDDLVAWVHGMCLEQGVRPQTGDVLVFAQKVVSKSEGRVVRLDTVDPSQEAQQLARTTGKDARIVELILSESVAVLRATAKVLIVRHRTGVVLANAGIDRSNVCQEGQGESVLLWPRDPDASARRLHLSACRVFGLHVPVVINDSLGRAWRRGTLGIAIGAAGVPSLVDLRGRPDRHGFVLQSTQVACTDEISAAASLLMGQASEGIAVVLVRGVPYVGDGRAADLIRSAPEDLFP